MTPRAEAIMALLVEFVVLAAILGVVRNFGNLGRRRSEGGTN